LAASATNIRSLNATVALGRHAPPPRRSVALAVAVDYPS
jgi:hypothetical protein